MGESLDLENLPGDLNIIALVSGLILLVLLSFSMSLIFIYLNRQLNLTRLYDNFIANVTHELKSPLSSIRMFVETMRKRNLSEEKRGEFLKMMEEDIDRLNYLINSILYLSSLENRKMAKTVSHDYHVYESDQLINDVLNELINEFKFESGQVTVSGKTSSECVVDRDWLKIVFSNLLDNARKYSLKSMQVNIQLSKDEKYIYIEFCDNGIGIPLHDQKRIFNKFERITNSHSPNVKGTGLGLYWVKQILAYHGGKITVSSLGQNRGTTFKIALPIYKSSKKHFINKLLKQTNKAKGVKS